MDAATLRTVQGPLLEALMACAGVTLRAVATSLELPVRGASLHGGVDTSMQLRRA